MGDNTYTTCGFDVRQHDPNEYSKNVSNKAQLTLQELLNNKTWDDCSSNQNALKYCDKMGGNLKEIGGVNNCCVLESENNKEHVHYGNTKKGWVGKWHGIPWKISNTRCKSKSKNNKCKTVKNIKGSCFQDKHNTWEKKDKEITEELTDEEEKELDEMGEESTKEPSEYELDKQLEELERELERELELTGGKSRKRKNRTRKRKSKSKRSKSKTRKRKSKSKTRKRKSKSKTRKRKSKSKTRKRKSKSKTRKRKSKSKTRKRKSKSKTRKNQKGGEKKIVNKSVEFGWGKDEDRKLHKCIEGCKEVSGEGYCVFETKENKSFFGKDKTVNQTVKCDKCDEDRCFLEYPGYIRLGEQLSDIKEDCLLIEKKYNILKLKLLKRVATQAEKLSLIRSIKPIKIQINTKITRYLSTLNQIFSTINETWHIYQRPIAIKKTVEQINEWTQELYNIMKTKDFITDLDLYKIKIGNYQLVNNETKIIMIISTDRYNILKKNPTFIKNYTVTKVQHPKFIKEKIKS